MKKLKLLYGISIILFCVTLVAAEPINLYDINITTNETWEFDTTYTITVHTLNLSYDPIDVTNVEIHPFEDVNYSSSPLVRNGVGSYSQQFLINKTSNVSSMHFNITATERTKWVHKSIEVSFYEDDWWTKLKETTKRYYHNTNEKFLKNLDNYWIIGGIALFAVLTIVLFLDMAFRRKNR